MVVRSGSGIGRDCGQGSVSGRCSVVVVVAVAEAIVLVVKAVVVVVLVVPSDQGVECSGMEEREEGRMEDDSIVFHMCASMVTDVCVVTILDNEQTQFDELKTLKDH